MAKIPDGALALHEPELLGMPRQKRNPCIDLNAASNKPRAVGDVIDLEDYTVTVVDCVENPAGGYEIGLRIVIIKPCAAANQERARKLVADRDNGKVS